MSDLDEQPPAPDIDAEVDVVCDRFEDAWRQGERPALDDFLPAETVLRQAVLAELVPIDLERRLAAGEDIRVESYLQRFPEIEQQPDKVVELIRAEYRLRKRVVPASECLERFPGFASLLKAQLALDSTHDHSPGTAPAECGERNLPERFGRYRIVRRLGKGAMGEVYQALDTYLQRTVALKVPVLSGSNKRILERFLREARAAAILHHPHICPVYEAGEIDGVPYFTMAYLEGLPLSQRFELPLDATSAARLTRFLALALGHAHAHGVVHRDLKPSNIFMASRDEPVIVDFGLALRVVPGEVRETLAGTVLGTPAYMAPEQARGETESLGAACDIYSLGVILYELLTGRVPFSGSFHEVIYRVGQEVPPPPSVHRPDLDRDLERICLRAMAGKKEERFPSMSAFAEALENWLARSDVAAIPQQEAAQADPRFVEESLDLIRCWGWEEGINVLKGRLGEAVDDAGRAQLGVLVGWLAGERGHDADAQSFFRASASWPGLAPWGLIGEAFVAMRQKRLAEAHTLLARAAALAGPDDHALQGALCHAQGNLAFHQGRFDEARDRLCRALEHVGADHFTTGRILDSLGMLRAAASDFFDAREFYAQALVCKQHHRDEVGIALSHGQLGRLYLTWHHLEEADEHLCAGLDIARRIGDERGEAQLCNHRGQVYLAQSRTSEAIAFLEEAVRGARERWPIIEAYARKDLALACLARNDVERADRECGEAERLFHEARFAEGAAHALAVRGLVHRARSRFEESARCLREGAGRFQGTSEPGEAARATWELARTLRLGGASDVLVAEALSRALDLARKSGRPHLITPIETELLEQRPRHYLENAFRTIDGAGPAGEQIATLLCVELRQRPQSKRGASDQMHDLSSLFVNLNTVFERYELRIVQNTGHGFLLLAQGREHEWRTFEAARAFMGTLQDVNRPRRVLGWPQWQACQVLATGLVYVERGAILRGTGSIVLGDPVALAYGLLGEARPDQICLSAAAYQALSSRLAGVSCKSRQCPRPGSESVPVWDVAAE